MNKQEARKIGNELRAKGMTYKEIAKELGKKGYVTELGRAPEWYDVNYLLNTHRYLNMVRRRRAAIRQTNVAVPPLGEHSLLVIKEIAFNHSLPCEARINIIQALLEPKRARKILEVPMDNAL